MNEAETRAELIDPKLKACGWGVIEGSKILRENAMLVRLHTEKYRWVVAEKNHLLPIIFWFTKASNWQLLRQKAINWKWAKVWHRQNKSLRTGFLLGCVPK